MKTSRVDVEVIAKFDLFGQITPLSLFYNGHCWKIDKVKYVTPAASLKAGGCGLRYTCLIDGKECFLFLEDSIWFIDKG